MAAERAPAPPGVEPQLIGVINLSPESRVPGSQVAGVAAARARAEQLVAAGAHLVELGGRSISEDRAEVDDQAEQARVLPVLRALVADGYRVAVDTWSEQTARLGLDAGAELINFTGSSPSLGLFRAVAAAAPASLALLYLPYPDPYAMRRAALRAYAPADIVAYFAAVARRATAAGGAAPVADPNLGIFHPGVDDTHKIALQIQAIDVLDELRDAGLRTLAYLARKEALSSRMLIAALLAVARPHYIRVHEPQIAAAALAAQAALARQARAAGTSASPGPGPGPDE